jgi:hypothetical protein
MLVTEISPSAKEDNTKDLDSRGNTQLEGKDSIEVSCRWQTDTKFIYRFIFWNE